MGWINRNQQQRDHAGQRNTCAACGRPGSHSHPLTTADDGYRVHASHTTDPTSGYHGHAQRS